MEKGESARFLAINDSGVSEMALRGLDGQSQFDFCINGQIKYRSSKYLTLLGRIYLIGTRELATLFYRSPAE